MPLPNERNVANKTNVVVFLASLPFLLSPLAVSYNFCSVYVRPSVRIRQGHNFYIYGLISNNLTQLSLMRSAI